MFSKGQGRERSFLGLRWSKRVATWWDPLLAFVFLLVCTGVCQAYEEGYPYNQYKNYKYKTSECGSYPLDMFDKGPARASCRITQLSHMINMGNKTVRKFIGIACARGSDLAEAKFNARSHARDLVSTMERDDLKAKGAKSETNQIYVTDNVVDHCVDTTVGAADKPPKDLEGYEPGEEEATEPSPPSRPAQAPLQAPNRATFIIHNRDRYTLGLEFYSQDRKAAWPGNNRQYNLKSDDTYNLNCRAGEKICFGAWRDYQTTYWGVGRNDKNGCERCCIRCGQSMETTLTDGGADAYPRSSSNSGGSDDVSTADVLNGMGAVLNAIGAARGSGGGVRYGGGSAPAQVPIRRPPNPYSGISGSTR